jgi:hypothetical protein
MERFFSKVNPIVHNRNLIKDSINELVEEIDGLEIVDDDDENSEDDSDGDV